MKAEVGQTWASTNAKDVAGGHNQGRRVLAIGVKHRWDGRQRVEVPAATLTCEGNGGCMRSRVALRPDGSIPGHVLVAEPDPRLVELAETLRGISTRPPYGHQDQFPSTYGPIPTHDLADEVLAAWLWPRLKDGSQNARIEVVLHQDALLAITQRIDTLVRALEQSALAET